MSLRLTISLFSQQYWMKWLSLIVRLFMFCFILVNHGMRIHNWQHDTESSFPSWKEGSTLLAQTSIHHENLSSIQEVIVTVWHLILRQFHLSNLQKWAGGVLSTQKESYESRQFEVGGGEERTALAVSIENLTASHHRSKHPSVPLTSRRSRHLSSPTAWIHLHYASLTTSATSSSIASSIMPSGTPGEQPIS